MNKISDLKVGDKVVLWSDGKIDTVTKLTFCGGANLAKSRHIHGNNVNWQKTNELNNNQMKELIIEAPTGMEVYLENKTIKFRGKTENKLPMSVQEIPNRNWFLTHKLEDYKLSTKERAEAFLALMQLVELRDAWNGDFDPEISKGEKKLFAINKYGDTILTSEGYFSVGVLYFGKRLLRDKFAEQFKDLIETAKELL